jgi:hypothetical protein
VAAAPEQAASPDEAALVVAAKVFGFFFFRRTPSSVVVREAECREPQAEGVPPATKCVHQVCLSLDTRKPYPDFQLPACTRHAPATLLSRTCRAPVALLLCTCRALVVHLSRS